jgi:hypothetical protein
MCFAYRRTFGRSRIVQIVSSRNQVEVVHLVACRTENNEVADSVVTALAVYMAHLQNIGDAEAAVRAHWRILRECQLPIIDAFHNARMAMPAKK